MHHVGAVLGINVLFLYLGVTVTILVLGIGQDTPLIVIGVPLPIIRFISINVIGHIAIPNVARVPRQQIAVGVVGVEYLVGGVATYRADVQLIAPFVVGDGPVVLNGTFGYLHVIIFPTNAVHVGVRVKFLVVITFVIVDLPHLNKVAVLIVGVLGSRVRVIVLIGVGQGNVHQRRQQFFRTGVGGFFQVTISFLIIAQFQLQFTVVVIAVGGAGGQGQNQQDGQGK